MNTEYSSNIVRIEPSPHANLGFTKIKMSTKQLGKDGEAVRMKKADGSFEYVMNVQDTVELATLPGTMRVIAPMNDKNGLITGLNKYVDNSYKDLKQNEYNPEWGFKALNGKDKVLLQTLLEYKHGVEQGYYRSNFKPVVTNDYNSVDNIPFYATNKCHLHLDNHITLLDLSRNEDELKYYLALADPRIAKNYEELEKDPHPYKWVIVDETEKQKVKALKEEIEVQASAYLFTLKQNIVSMKRMARILGCKEVNNSDTEGHGYFSYIYNYYKAGENNYKEFVYWYKKNEDPVTREEYICAALLEDYIDANVIRRRDNKYFMTLTDEKTSAQRNFEWTSREHIIKAFFLAPEFQEEREMAKGLLAKNTEQFLSKYQ